MNAVIFPFQKTYHLGLLVLRRIPLVFEGTWELTDQLLDGPPDGIEAFEVNPLTGQLTGQPMSLLKLERVYILQARTDETLKFIASAGLIDVHEIAGSAFATLNNYVDFFCKETDVQPIVKPDMGKLW